MSLSAFRDTLVATQQTFRVQIIWTISYLAETVLIFVLISAGRGIKGLAEAFVIRTMPGDCLLLLYRVPISTLA